MIFQLVREWSARCALSNVRYMAFRACLSSTEVETVTSSTWSSPENALDNGAEAIRSYCGYQHMHSMVICYTLTACHLEPPQDRQPHMASLPLCCSAVPVVGVWSNDGAERSCGLHICVSARSFATTNFTTEWIYEGKHDSQNITPWLFSRWKTGSVSATLILALHLDRMTPIRREYWLMTQRP